MEALITFQDVSFTWPGGTGLAGVSFAVFPGDFVRVVGPSGAGKSTLLRLVARLEVPSAGSIRYRSTPVDALPPAQLRRRLALVQQTPTVVAGTVRENLLLPWSFAVNRELPQPDDATLHQWLARVRLDGTRLDADALSLSVGQKQRLCLVRTLLTSPDALLMDEPTSALDAESRRVVEELTEERNAAGVAVLLVTHTDYCPMDRSVRCLAVRDGRVEEVA